MAWTEEHDLLVCNYIKEHKGEEAREATLNIMAQLEWEFSYQEVLVYVCYWIGRLSYSVAS